MITGIALKIPQPNRSDENLLSDAPEGQHDGFWLNIDGVITNPAAGAVVGDQADVNDFLGHAIGAFLLEDRLASGPDGNGRPLYEAADGYDLRKIHRFVTRTEVECNLLGANIAAGADLAVKAKLYIPFSIWWLNGTRKRPGHTQMRRLFMRIVEKNEATFGGPGGNRYVRKVGGFYMYEVQYDVKPGPDQIASLLSLARVTEPRRIMRGPGGQTLVAWETTPLANTALTAFKVRLGDGDRQTLVHDLRDPDVLAQQFKIEHPDADQDISVDGTPLYFVEEAVDIDEVAHGEVEFEQANQQLAPINGRYLYYPEHDPDQTRKAIGQAAILKKQPVLASVPSITNPRAAYGAASTANIVLYPTSDARFVSEPGILGLVNGQTQVAIPAPVQANAAKAVAAAKSEGEHVGQAVGRRFGKMIANRVPAAVDSNGRGAGTQREEVRRQLGK